jgi:WD domain, G-beta repeat
LWDVQTKQLLKTLTDHTDCVTCVAFNRDGNLLVSGSDDKSVKVWSVVNAVTAQLVETLPPAHTDGVTCVSFSPDGTRIASGSKDRTVCIYEVVGNNYTVSNVLKKHCGGITSVAFSPDGLNLVSADDKADEVDMDLMNTSKYADLVLETLPQLFIQFSNTLLTNTVSTAFIISMIWTIGNAFWNLYHLCYYVFVIGEKITDWKTFMRKVRNIPQPTTDLNNFSYRYDVANEAAAFNAWMSKVKGYFTWLCCPLKVANEQADQRIQQYEMVRQQSKERHDIEERELENRISQLEANVDKVVLQRADSSNRHTLEKNRLIALIAQHLEEKKIMEERIRELEAGDIEVEAIAFL